MGVPGRVSKEHRPRAQELTPESKKYKKYIAKPYICHQGAVARSLGDHPGKPQVRAVSRPDTQFQESAPFRVKKLMCLQQFAI